MVKRALTATVRKLMQVPPPDFCCWHVAKYIAEWWDKDYFTGTKLCLGNAVTCCFCECHFFFPALLDLFTGILYMWYSTRFVFWGVFLGLDQCWEFLYVDYFSR